MNVLPIAKHQSSKVELLNAPWRGLKAVLSQSTYCLNQVVELLNAPWRGLKATLLYSGEPMPVTLNCSMPRGGD